MAGRYRRLADDGRASRRGDTGLEEGERNRGAGDRDAVDRGAGDRGAHHEAVAYRADIDGLRAIAVVAVVLFHAKLPWLSGGYVGVDVFFVISGFLITAILLQNNSIVRFYERRMQRILPALYAMIAAVLVVGTLVMLPHDFVAMASSSVATLLFSSNIWFWRQSGYFAVETELWPLLHTWSLGVEEQFYIAFPILIKLASRLSRRWLAIVFAVIAALSLFAAVFAIGHGKAVLAFYLVPMRAWELLVGSILATGVVTVRVGPRVRALVAALGLAAIAGSALFYTSATTFPGWAALLPVLGTALVIWAGQQGPHPLSPILGCRPMRGIGLVSYSLYLWHWPVLAFMRYVIVRDLTVAETLLAVVAMGVLAVLSWRYVERPFRGRTRTWRTWLSFLGIGLALLAASVGIVAGHGWLQRFDPKVARLNANEGETWRCPVTSLVVFGNFYACPLGPKVHKPEDARIVLWGDSHAQMYAPALAGRDVLLVNANGCAPVMGDAADPSCGAIQRGNYERIVALPAKTVILAQNWPQYRDEASTRLGRDPLPAERYQDGIRRLRDLVAGLRSHGKQVVVIGPVALPGYNIASVAARDLAFHGRIGTATSVSRADYLREHANILAALDRLGAQPGVQVVRVDQWVCRQDLCPFIVDGRAVFADYGHYATDYARAMKPLFDRALVGAETPAR